MQKEQIINSVLDTDLYKLTMGQAVWNNYPQVETRYKFINRGQTRFPENFAEKLMTEVNSMAKIRLSLVEKKFLREKCTYLKSEYLDWLESYRFRPEQVRVEQLEGKLKVDIIGPWKETIFWEVPLMAAISELFFLETGQKPKDGWREMAAKKTEDLKEMGAKYMEFGTRRRYSRLIQEGVMEEIVRGSGAEFLGTSNVDLARKMNLIPRGTYAHEWVMGAAGVFGEEPANQVAMDMWQKEFGGQLATALTDTYTTPLFLRDFDQRRGNQFRTLRQDSGSPEKWTDMVVGHIEKVLGQNAANFTALYSDSLGMSRVRSLSEYAEKIGIKSAFGIGTNLSNDVGVRPLNMVIKMAAIRDEDGSWKEVIKLSDDVGKISGSSEKILEVRKKLEI